MSESYYRDGILCKQARRLSQPETTLHFDANGLLSGVSEDLLRPGEGLLRYNGTLNVKPLEIYVEFLKAEDAETWLEGLLIRHINYTRTNDITLNIDASIADN